MTKNSLILFISVILSLSLFYSCNKQDLSDNEAPKIDISESINKNNILYIDSLGIWKFKLSDNESLSSFYIKIYHPNHNPKEEDRKDSVYYYRLFVNGGIFSTIKKDTIITDSILIDSKITKDKLPIVTGIYNMEISVMDIIGNENKQNFNIQIKNKPKLNKQF